MLLECKTPLRQGEHLDLLIPEAGAAEAEIVWTSGHFFGCKFRVPLSTAAVSAASLRSPDPNAAATPAADPNAQGVYAALIELRQLAKVIEKITDRVDRAIDRLSKREC
jgi:hypothetical protein